MRQSESIAKISAALAAFQGEMVNVPKNAVNPHYKNKYATLDAIVKATRPVLAKHGLAVVQGGKVRDAGSMVVETMITHTSGEWLVSEIVMRPDKDNPQGVVGMMTYARRAGYAILGIATDDDDDGNSASGGGRKKKDAAPEPPRAPAPPPPPKKGSNALLAPISKGISAINSLVKEQAAENLSEDKAKDFAARRKITDAHIKLWAKAFVDGKSRSEWTAADVEKCRQFLKDIYARVKANADIITDIEALEGFANGDT